MTGAANYSQLIKIIFYTCNQRMLYYLVFYFVGNKNRLFSFFFRTKVGKIKHYNVTWFVHINKLVLLIFLLRKLYNGISTNPELTIKSCEQIINCSSPISSRSNISLSLSLSPVNF